MNRTARGKDLFPGEIPAWARRPESLCAFGCGLCWLRRGSWVWLLRLGEACCTRDADADCWVAPSRPVRIADSRVAVLSAGDLAAGSEVERDRLCRAPAALGFCHRLSG